MSSVTRLLPVAAVAAIVLGACTGPGDTVIYNRHIDATYRAQEFWMQTAGRDLRTEIHGNPFPVEDGALADAVVTAMYGAHFGPETNFVTTPGDHNAHPYWVRLLFNALPVGGSGPCAEAPVDMPPASADAGGQGHDVRLLAAFCAGDSRITSLTAGVDGITGPDDPAFRNFIRRVTLALFPPNNPDQNRDRCFVPGC